MKRGVVEQPLLHELGADTRDRSGPASASTLSAVPVSIPSMRVRSTPHTRNSAVRRSNFAALRGRPRRLGGSAGASWHAKHPKRLSSCRSHSAIACT